MNRNSLRHESHSWEFPGCDLTAEQIEFGRVMEAYQRRTGLRYPTACDVLREAKRIGYRKVTDASVDCRLSGD